MRPLRAHDADQGTGDALRLPGGAAGDADPLQHRADPARSRGARHPCLPRDWAARNGGHALGRREQMIRPSEKGSQPLLAPSFVLSKPYRCGTGYTGWKV